MTSPDPVPAAMPFGPFTAIVTTLGMTLSAADVTGHEPSEELDAGMLAAAVAYADASDEDAAAPIRPPATPPAASAIASAAPNRHRRMPTPRLAPACPAAPALRSWRTP